MTDITDSPSPRRIAAYRGLSEFLGEEFGLKLSPQTLTRYGSEGIGPKPDEYWRRTPIWHDTTVRNWALARLRPAHAS